MIEDEAGTRHVCGAGGTDGGRFSVRDDRTWSAVALRGSIGLGESYAQGWWDCDDLTSLLRILLAALRPATTTLDRMGTTTARFADPVRRLKVTRRARDQRNIRAHYDISNDFFGSDARPDHDLLVRAVRRPQLSLHAQTPSSTESAGSSRSRPWTMCSRWAAAGAASPSTPPRGTAAGVTTTTISRRTTRARCQAGRRRGTPAPHHCAARPLPRPHRAIHRSSSRSR